MSHTTIRLQPGYSASPITVGIRPAQAHRNTVPLKPWFSERYARIKNDHYFGQFRIVGQTVRKAGTAIAPTTGRVALIDEVTGNLVRMTTANPTTGQYSFENIRGDIRYTLLAWDITVDSLPAVIADNIQPEPMP